MTGRASCRRRRACLAAALLFVVAATVAAAVHHPRRDPDHYLSADDHRAFLSTNGWPVLGQGAYQVGDELSRTSAHETPVPIASLAKVMTAYRVLEHHPLSVTGDDPSFVVRASDVADTTERRNDGQSVVDVRAGELMTERDALMALLLPSANNIAVMLAREVSGSVPAFVREMNTTARQLGMTDTTYTDPSGYDSRTVSTAIDQLRLAESVAQNPTLAAMMATRSYQLPVAGNVRNTNALLGQDGFVGMKTGSDDAAGGCLMFRSRREVAGHEVEVIGVVLGQRGPDLISAVLHAAKQLVDRFAPEAVN